MKLRDIGSFAVNAMELGSHANTVGDIARIVLGKGTDTSGTESSGKSKSWMKGAFNHDDEIKVSQLLADLIKTDPEGVKMFLRFLVQKFPRGKTFAERAANFRTRNAFMHFIVEHNNEAPKQYKVSEVIKEDKGGSKTTTIEWGVASKEANKSLEFIKGCIATIRSEPTEAKGRNLLMKELEAINAPTPSTALADTIETAIKRSKEAAAATEVWLEGEIQAMEDDTSLFGRFSNWLARKGL